MVIRTRSHPGQTKNDKRRPRSAQPVSPQASILASRSASLALQRVIARPAAATSTDLLTLQRTCGNQGVDQLLARSRLQQGDVTPSLPIQPQLRVKGAGDRYEQEADHIAEQVVGKPAVATVQHTTQRKVIQRAIPSDQQWKKRSKRFGYSRSAALITVDNALQAWNARAPDASSATQIQLLSKIHDAIQAWKNTKEMDEDENVQSMRIADVHFLEDEIEKVRVGIEKGTTQSLDLAAGGIPHNFSDLSVFSTGSMIAESGAFMGESEQEYLAVKARLQEENKASSEADIRIAMLTAKIQEAYAKLNQESARLGPTKQIVGLFTAPEWYFKQPGTPFRESDKLKIGNAFQSLSASCQNMVIVPGSVVWRKGRGDTAELRNTAMAFMNGSKLHEINKRQEGFDTRGYYRRDENKDRDAAKRMQEWKRGGGVDAVKGGPTGPEGISVQDAPSLFDVGSLTFSLEICADHGAKRALMDMTKRGVKPQGAHVQVLISHGAELMETGSVLRDGGIAVSTDATDLGTNKLGEKVGGVRNVYQGGMDAATNRRARYEKKVDLAQLFMGTYQLPH